MKRILLIAALTLVSFHIGINAQSNTERLKQIMDDWNKAYIDACFNNSSAKEFGYNLGTDVKMDSLIELNYTYEQGTANLIDSTKWVYYSEQIWDQEDRIIERVLFVMNDPGGREDVIKMEFTYTVNSVKILSLFYNPDTQIWEVDMGELYEYKDGLLVRYLELFDDAIEDSHHYYYDELGNDTLYIEFQHYNQGIDSVPMKKLAYTYNENQKVLGSRYGWNENTSTWDYFGKDEFEYDELDRLDSSTLWNWDGANYNLTILTDYSYVNDNIIVEETYTGVYKNIIHKNSSGIKTFEQFYEWNETAQLFLLSSAEYYFISEKEPELPPHFIPVWEGNGLDHMNFYALFAILDDVDLQPGDEIAVFDGDYCVGAAILSEVLVPGQNYLSFVVSKNDATPPDINGYSPGNDVNFRIWDVSEEKEISNIQVDYVSGTGIFSIGGTVSFNLTALSTIEQLISLSEGWNIISFMHVAENTTLMELLQPLIDNGTLIKVQDETGAAIEYVEPIGWVDNIQGFDPTEGYKIKVSGDVDLTTIGLPITGPFEIPLVEGWNIISYPLNSEQNTQTVLADLISDGALLKVQDETGAAIENIFPIGWVFNIPVFKPGEGYKIKVSKNTSIIFNEPSTKSFLYNKPAETTKSTHFNTIWTGNGLDHMNFYITKATISDLNMQASDEIAVYDGDNCVGVGVLTEEIIEGQNYLTFVASKNDASPPDINGYTPGNTVSFRIWDYSELIEIVNIETTYLSGETIFTVGGTSSLKVNGIPNEAPVITGQMVLSTPEETPKDLELTDLTVVDGDNIYPDDFTLSINPGDHYSVNDHTITPETDFYGDLTVPVKVSDGLAESALFNLTISVTNVNDVPAFTSYPVTEINAGSLYTYSITTYDPDLEDVIQIGLSGTIPTWLSITDHGDRTATLSGTPTSSDSGIQEIIISLTDGIIPQSVTQTFNLSVITGIFNPETNFSIKIYPNPADEFINVPIAGLYRKGILVIYNIRGEKLFKQIIKSSVSEDLLINISDLAKGSYFITISDTEKVSYGKFIIQ